MRYGMTRFTYETLSRASTRREFRRAWMLDNPRWRRGVRYAGRHYTLVSYETISANDECVVDIIELKNASGVRLGWAEVFHPRRSTSAAPVQSRVKELYVSPPFRRRGYGTILEAAATMTAMMRKSRRMLIDLYEPDARPSMRRAPRRFALSRGYAWRWERGSGSTGRLLHEDDNLIGCTCARKRRI